MSDTWTYDGFGAQSSYTVKSSDGTVLYAMYGSGGIGTPITRDAKARITAMNETINGATHSWAMTYDARGRLESVTLDGTTSTYGYDPNGNMTTLNGAPFGTYDAQDRLLSLTPPGEGAAWNFDYTNNGDLTYKTNGTEDYAFDYDLSSNLRNVQVNAATVTAGVTYTIDGANRRIARSIVPTIGARVADGLLYDDRGRVVAEIDGSNNVLSTFVYGLRSNVPDYMVRSGTAYRIVSDWRGDVRLVLNTMQMGTAAVVQEIDYDAWGSVTNLVDPSCSVAGTLPCFQPFGFAGGMWETSTGLVRFGARDYDPQTRRWTQKDPIGFQGGQANIYQYVADDPMNGSDPTGLKDLLLCLQLVELGQFANLAACLLAPEGGIPYRVTPDDCDQVWEDTYRTCINSGGSQGDCFFAANAACRKKNAENFPSGNSCPNPILIPELISLELPLIP